MRGIGDLTNIGYAIERERTRRHYEALDPKERDAEIRKYLVDVSAVAVDRLIGALTDNPLQHETQRRHLEQVADELAGPNATPLVQLLARSVAILGLERDLADARFYGILSDPEGVAFGFSRDLLQWRQFVHRRLNAAVRTLAGVRRLEIPAVERTAERLRILGRAG